MKRFLSLVAVLWAAIGSAQTTVSFEKIFHETHSREQKYGIQGASVAEGTLFQLHDGNKPIVMYNLADGSFLGEIAVEPLKTWHNNTASFSNIWFDKKDPYPLLYASQENVNEHKAVVYRFRKEHDGRITASIVQTIVFPEPRAMGIYYPNLALDLDAGFLYLTGFSWESWKDPSHGNSVQILRFRLPSPKEGKVVELTTKDIQKRFCTDFKLATQGATVSGGKLYQVFGLPGNSCLVVVDLETGKELLRTDIGGVPGEPEGLGISDGHLILSCGDGDVFRSVLPVQSDVFSGKASDRAHVCAYVWPSCHDDQLGHKWLWEEGIGEWEVIKQGDKRFPDHYQPRQPLWGYEMDNDPVVVEKWIQTALKYGVNTFIYDWYWYNDPDGYSGPYLESALNDGFLKAPSHGKMNFYIMWANHDVKYNYWNYHKWGDNEERLFNPDVDWDQFKKVVARVIDQYFKLPEYVKIDGCPVFAIFSIGNFVRSFGSLEEAAKAMEYFRAEVKKAGFPDLHLQEIQGGGSRMNESRIAAMKKNIDALGINSEALYNMGGFNPDYLVQGNEAIEIRKQMDEVFDIPVFPCVSIGWDDTPRFPAKGPDDVTRFHNTPQSFATFLAKAKEYMDGHTDQPRFMMINAWNEWVEGSYLLPDRLNGFGYLEAVRDVLDGKYD